MYTFVRNLLSSSPKWRNNFILPHLYSFSSFVYICLFKNLHLIFVSCWYIRNKSDFECCSCVREKFWTLLLIMSLHINLLGFFCVSWLIPTRYKHVVMLKHSHITSLSPQRVYNLRVGSRQANELAYYNMTLKYYKKIGWRLW